MKSSIDSGKHKFHHHKPSEHTWQPSMRESVSVIDLDLQKATNGQFTGHHFIKNGKKDPGSGPKSQGSWHVHEECAFDWNYVLNGWAEFEFEGVGVVRLEKGDSWYQPPGIRHRELSASEDFEGMQIICGAHSSREVPEPE